MATQDVSFSIEVELCLSANMIKTDYGVPGSPVFWVADDFDFQSSTVMIAGIDVAVSDLPKALQNAILEEAIEKCDDDGWEDGE